MERYELHLLREVHGWHAAPHEASCHELLFSQCAIGASGGAVRAIRQEIPNRLAQHGGQLIGAFECITGVDLPRFAFWIAWKPRQARDAGVDLLALPPLGRTQRWLLDPDTDHPLSTHPRPEETQP